MIDIEYLNKLHGEKQEDPEFKKFYDGVCKLIKRNSDLEEAAKNV